MGFFDDFATGFKMPFEWSWDHIGERVVNIADKSLDAAGNLASGAAGAANGLASLLSGNSNILLYAGLGIVAVVVLPVILQKVL